MRNSKSTHPHTPSRTTSIPQSSNSSNYLPSNQPHTYHSPSAYQSESDNRYDQCNALVRKREADRLKVVIAKEKRKQDLADIYSALVSAPYYVSLGAPPGTSSDRKNRAIDSNTSKYFEEDDDEDAADTRRARKAATASQYVCRGVHTSSIDADVRIFSLADRK